MKKIVLTTSIITTLGVANNFVNYNLLTNNSIEENNNLETNSSLSNSAYQLLNTTTVVANQTEDNKFYSYDLKEFTGNLSDGTDPKTLFFVDRDGALQFKSGAEAKIPQIDHQNILNTKKSIEENKKIVTVSQPIDWTRSYYNKSGYFSNNWQYLQLGGIENHIDISKQLNASLVTYSNDLSESWGLYYIAQAVRNKKIDIKIADDLANYFISKSTLKDSIKNLTLPIMQLLETNDTFYNFIGNAPFSNISINYYYDLIFDSSNNLISATYQKAQNVVNELNYHYRDSYSGVIQDYSEASDTYNLIEWSKYAPSWDIFNKLYCNFNFSDHSYISVVIRTGYSNTVGFERSVAVNKILVNQGSGDTNMIFRASADSRGQQSIGTYIWANLNIWHNNNVILFKWFAESFSNWGASSFFEIRLDSVIFVPFN